MTINVVDGLFAMMSLEYFEDTELDHWGSTSASRWNMKDMSPWAVTCGKLREKSPVISRGR